MVFKSPISTLFALVLLQVQVLQAQPVPESERLFQLSPQVSTDETCEGRLELGNATVIKVDGAPHVSIPLKNLSTQPLTVATKTCYYRADGSLIEDPSPKPTGGLEGIARGFIGVVSLGMSEAMMAQSSVMTIREIAPGGILQVKHDLNDVADTVVRVESKVSIIPTSHEQANQQQIRKAMEAKFSKVRENYLLSRRSELNRWYALKDQLQARKASFSPMSPDYRKVMDQFWTEHKAHMSRLDQIEDQFNALEAKQQEALQDALQ